MKLTELKQRQPQHLMVFGRSKSGKSTLVSQLASRFKLVWISLDNGQEVLYKLPPEAQENVDIIVLPDTRDFPVAIDTMRKLSKGDAATLCHYHGKVNCAACKKVGAPTSDYEFNKLGLDTIVVVDHITQLTDSCMALICKDKPVDYKPKLDDWGSLRFHMLEFCSNIQQASFNVVCIAQEMEAEMEDGKKLITPQVGSREFGKSVGSFFDHIIYCEVMNKSHRVGSGTTYSASVLTGSRSDVEVEKLKSGEQSLLPFFSGAKSKKHESFGAAVAATVLAPKAVAETNQVIEAAKSDDGKFAISGSVDSGNAGADSSLDTAAIRQKALAMLGKR